MEQLNTASYAPLPQDEEGSSPSRITRKPVHRNQVKISAAPSASELLIPSIPASSSDRSSANTRLRSNSVHSEYETITVQRGTFKKLVEALAASVVLLQDAVNHTNSKELQDPELGLNNDENGIIDEAMQMRLQFSNELVGVKKLPAKYVKHADDILESIFIKGLCPS